MRDPAPVSRDPRADDHGRGRADRGGLPLCQLCSSSNRFWLAGSEGDDAPDGIVWRNADGDAIARDYLDAEAAHSAAELGQHLMACIALHPVKTAAVDRNHGALHINEIILAQLLARPFFQTNIVPHFHLVIYSFGYLVIGFFRDLFFNNQMTR